MSDALRIAVAGLGTVGAGLVELLQANAGLIARRCGRAIEIVDVSARDRARNRGVDISAYTWHDDAVAMAENTPADVVVELIGGADGVAKAVCQAALARGRHVVSANKALLAEHGLELARMAEASGAALQFEAAVAGGIPVVKALREGLAGNKIARVYGILNGTCNHILSDMRTSGRDFDIVLDEAQQLGYAESDPSTDVDGHDAAHKLAILASLAFGCPPDLDAVFVDGIRHVSPLDIDYADELGYRIKLLGIARLTEFGLEQRVHPCMVPLDAPIAHVEGVFNAVVIEGDRVGKSVYEGRGAGGGPTASAVASDLIDLARGNRVPAFGIEASALVPLPSAPMESHRGAYYLRLVVHDVPGVIAGVSAALAEMGVSLRRVLQQGGGGGNGDEEVSLVLVTHDTEEAAMRRALDKIAAMATVLQAPRLIRIEPF